MPAKRAKRPTSRPTKLARYLLVERWRASVSSYYSPVGFEPRSANLHLHGHLDEPLRGITEAHAQIGVDNDWEDRKSAGAIIGIKPLVQLVIMVPPVQFERLWQLTAANACRSLRFVFTEPKRSSAMITDWYASTNLPDEDE